LTPKLGHSEISCAISVSLEKPLTSTRRIRLQALLIFFGFLLLFFLLRSDDPFGTDGPFRALEVYRRGSLFFHAGNHLLYPANVFAWTHFASKMGFPVHDPQSFLLTVALMNCLAGAACLALFFTITALASQSWRIAMITTMIFGLSKAFLTHATNASEPMVGLFWSFAATTVAILSIKKNSTGLVILAGFLFALALTTYQSTVLFGPAALYWIWSSRKKSAGELRQEFSGVVLAMFFGLGAVIGSALIYGTAAYSFWRHQSTRTTATQIAAHVLEPVDTHAYLGVGLGKLAQLPVGLVSNLFPVLSNFTGLRNFVHGPVAPLLGIVGLLVGVGTLLMFCIWQCVSQWKMLSVLQRRVIIAGTLGFAFTMVPVVAFSQLYDKLWIQPLACLLLLLAVSVHLANQTRPRLRFVAAGLSVLALSGVFLNLRNVSLRGSPHPEMSEAQRLAQMIQSNDLVVGDWDGVSVVYGFAWAADGQFFSFTSNAASFGTKATSNLRDEIFKTQQKGGRVFFLSILDVPRESWESFLGSKCGVPFSELDDYRQHSVVRAEFHTRFRDVPLRELIARQGGG
jgi:hypothetical protein